MTSEAAAELQRLREASEAVRARAAVQPRVAIVLGTGLGGLGEAVEDAVSLQYGAVPHFPPTSVEGHEGRLLLGRLEGVPTAILQGRPHLYEGHEASRAVFPLRVLGLLGVDTLIITAIAGGMNPLWELGDLVVLDDHINLMGQNPLVGPNLDELGPRFPDMSEPYDRELQRLALQAGLAEGLALRRGVYVGVLGPNLETRAEYRMLRALGGDVVGMSTVPEVIAARHMGMRVLGLTVVSDLCLPDALEPVDVPTLLRIAGAAEPKLAKVITGVLARLEDGE